MARMKLIAAAALTLALGAPLLAQQWQMPPAEDAPNAAPQAQDPLTTPGDNSDGLEQDLEGIMSEMFQRLQPHLEGLANELSSTADEFRPALNELGGVMDDIANYERPERLPNGDILIRRRADAPAAAGGVAAPVAAGARTDPDTTDAAGPHRARDRALTAPASGPVRFCRVRMVVTLFWHIRPEDLERRLNHVLHLRRDCIRSCIDGAGTTASDAAR